MIDGATRLLGLIGHPLSHSLSPFFQNYLLARSGLNARYVPFPVERADALRDALRGLAAAGLAGVNVTIPHKVAAAALCDELSRDARAAGAVNTIVFRGGRLEGHNTDIPGFLAPLTAGRVTVAGRQCVVLGAGGAARAIAFALARSGGLVTVTARDRTRALEVAAAAESASEGMLHAVAWEERAGAIAEAHLVVNATPLGQVGPRAGASPLDAGTPVRAEQVFYDLVYNPVRTRFLEQAREGRATAIAGLEMLVEQGIASLELWLGLRFDRAVTADVVRRCEEELERRTAWVASGT